MPSAAARVFALPELLEPILLDLPWYNPFPLLRTNTTFRDTITKSTKVRRRMHLEFKLQYDLPQTKQWIKSYHPPDPWSFICAETFEGRKALTPMTSGFYEFIENDRRTYRGLNVSFFELISIEWDGGFPENPVKVHIIGTMPSSQVSEKPLIRNAKRRQLHRDRRNASWRPIKLTDLPGAVHISFDMHRRRSFEFQYNERIEFAPGEGSLGKLFDMLDRIRKRTPEEHSKLRKQLRERDLDQ